MSGRIVTTRPIPGYAVIGLVDGGDFDLVSPDPNVIHIGAIAHGLGRICRFTGQCSEHYSVAEHSVHASYLVEEDEQLSALMHDAAEFVVGDMSQPMKRLVPEFAWVEKRVEVAIQRRFLLPEMSPAVKHADRLMLRAEQTQVMRRDDEDWQGLEGIEAPDVRIGFWSPAVATSQFLDRFHELAVRRQLKWGTPPWKDV